MVLSFQGANDRTQVWLNGVPLGGNADPFLPFSFEVHRHLVEHGRNLLAVRVDNAPRPEDLPGRYVGWRRFGGILREVNLSMVPDAQVDDYVLVHVGVAISKIDEEEARLTLDYLKQIGEAAP